MKIWSLKQTKLHYFLQFHPDRDFCEINHCRKRDKMNTRARTTRDTQGQVGQRKKELANKLSFASQANSLQKVTFCELD